MFFFLIRDNPTSEKVLLMNAFNTTKLRCKYTTFFIVCHANHSFYVIKNYQLARTFL